MKLHVLLALLGLSFLGSCLSLQGDLVEDLDSTLLDKLGISNAQESESYDFSEFYKTSGLENFQFAPDGSNVYFLKSDGNVKNVFGFDIRSRKMFQVTEYSEPVSDYAVDPDGGRLYIEKDVGGSEIYDLYEFDLSTKKTLPITEGGNVERSFLCDVSSDGRKIYVAQSRQERAFYDLVQFDTKTKTFKTLLRSNDEQLYCGELDDSDRYLAFVRYIDNNEIHQGYLDLESQSVRYVLAEGGIKNSHATFDSKGGLLFLSTKDSDLVRLWRYDFASQKLSLADQPVDRDIETIAVYARGGVSVVNYRDRLEGKTKIFRGLFAEEYEAPLSPTTIKGATFAQKDKNLGILEIQEGSAPLKYYLVQAGTKTLIYDSNQSKIPSHSFSQSHSRFIESFDGTMVPTHFFIPNGTSSKNKKPVIFWIHGGPEDHIDPIYSPRIQFLVNNGFVVVAPNVRGSTGFGKRYQFMDDGDWGGGHIRDIVAVAHYTKNIDFVLPDQMMILGGSFGGFSVMSLITQYPQLFATAVNIFGPIDFAAFLDSWPPNGQDYWLKELGADPRKDAAFNRKVSPYYHIDKIKIPLQVHQGANDIRVPKSQSDQLVEGLKRQSIPVDYHVYSDEGHGFTKFENAKECFTRIVDFAKAHMGTDNDQRE